MTTVTGHRTARRWAVRIGAAVAAALIVGVPAALVGRLLMRLVVLAEGGLPEPPTLVGTTGIVLTFVVFALPATVTMAAAPHLATRIGLVFAALFTVFPAGPIAAGDLSDYFGLLSPGRQVATVAVLAGFVVLFAAYGRLLALVVVRLLGRPGAAGAASGRS